MKNFFLVGDSTVAEFHDDYYIPRYGYGTQLHSFFKQNSFNFRNLALSGRSSRSFTTEENYKILKEELKEGDYLLVAFGHNDEKKDPARFTSAEGDEFTKGSFANSLYENYYLLAKERKANLIMCTPIVRRSASGEFAGHEVHETVENETFAAGNYPEVTRKLCSKYQILLIDMTKLTKEEYIKLGPTETAKLHAWVNEDISSIDNTHTSLEGAKKNASLVAESIKKAGICGLSEYVL